jgi:gamma-glutamyl-gamma-aminobutyrate hydrolase PuuD
MTQFEYAFDHNIPMIGICRGGQFLNVMCGGKMWQDVDKHAIRGTHLAIDLASGEEVEVTSTHHQMMKPSDEGILLLQATFIAEVRSPMLMAHMRGVEAVLYPHYNTLCFQPHPEYGECPTRELFFEYIKTHLKIKE